jgi:hypothetical protein
MSARLCPNTPCPAVRARPSHRRCSTASAVVSTTTVSVARAVPSPFFIRGTSSSPSPPPRHHRTTAGHRSPTSSKGRCRRAGFILLAVDEELCSPCPTGSLTVVGARPPPFAPSLPLWCRRRPRHDARVGAVTAPACAALHRAVAGRAGRGRPSERRPCPRGRGPRTRCARGLSRRRGRGPSTTVHLGRAWFRPRGTQIDFFYFLIYSILCKFKNLCKIHLNSENYETNFVGKV